nr:ShlB/FhaC/HecB family hemolysin secretion/activation protein [uncultured Anaeromusa sp.]
MKITTRLYSVPAFVVVTGLLFASSAAAAPPDAGSTLKNTQEQQRVLPPATTTGIHIEEAATQAPAAGGETLTVHEFRFTGQDAIPASDLNALVADSLDKPLTLAELYQRADRISLYLRQKGYLVAKAYIPPQESSDNTVTITIVLGQYEKIDIRNHSRVPTSYLEALTKPLLKNGSYVHQQELERALLLISDISGLRLKSTLAPGQEPGTSLLILECEDAPPIHGQLSTDNWGNRFTGDVRGGLNLTIDNPGSLGDSFSLGGLYTGSGMNNASFSYTLPVGSGGGKLGISYSRVHYLLGENYTNLDANGVAKTTSLFGSYPLTRSRTHNLRFHWGFEHKDLEDLVGSTSNSQKQANAVSLGLAGDAYDADGNGLNTFDFTVYQGHLMMGSADARTNDANVQSEGNYTKSILNLYRQKYLNSRLSYSLSFTGQLASHNLDSSEKLFLGGATGVRAYPQGEAAGDTGYLASGELCWNLPTPAVQLAAFVDHGHVTLNKNTWTGAGGNTRTLSGAGLGLILSRPGDYSLRLDYAWKLGSETAQSDTDKNGRFWFRASKSF